MEIKQAAKALTALAQESRLAVFRLLVPTGSAGLPAGEIADELGIPSATLTFHLKELSHAGLVESRREGRSIIYSLRCDTMRELLTFLARDCCQGQPELCGPTCSTPKRRAKAASK
jgi:DNA-binding transcriptional ArsR family regulator